MFILFISGYLLRTFVNMELVEGNLHHLFDCSLSILAASFAQTRRGLAITREELSVCFAGDNLFRTLRLNYSDCVLTRLPHG
jgi:hypothetical protein